MSVVLDGAADVTGGSMQVAFDPKLLRLNDVILGGLMGADGQQPVVSKNIQNEIGQATIQLNRQAGAPGITAPTGVLVFLNFQAVGKGTATVNMSNVGIRNSQGQVVASGNPQAAVNIK
jgi:hypothetical protein